MSSTSTATVRFISPPSQPTAEHYPFRPSEASGITRFSVRIGRQLCKAVKADGKPKITLCRIRSTDWVKNRDKQVQQVFAVLEAGDSRSDPAVTAPPPADYKSIDDVPEHVIRTTALAVTTEVGAVGPDDLYGAVATWLGFKRLGARIKTRIAESVSSLVDGVAVPATHEHLALRVEGHTDLDLKR